jgi:hypothetical protein
VLSGTSSCWFCSGIALGCGAAVMLRVSETQFAAHVQIMIIPYPKTKLRLSIPPELKYKYL